MDKYSFDLSESMAVARLVWVLIFSDGGIDRRESDFFEQMLQKMGISFETFESCLLEPIEHVYDVVKAMSAEKRMEFANLLHLAIGVDKVVMLSELSRLNDILEKTSIFRPDENNMKKTENGFE